MDGIQWINPVSMSNQYEPNDCSEDWENALEGVRLPQAVMIVKVMLLDLAAEVDQIEREESDLVSDYYDPNKSSEEIGGFLNIFWKIKKENKQILMGTLEKMKVNGATEEELERRKRIMEPPSFPANQRNTSKQCFAANGCDIIQIILIKG